ncbi:MAG: dihydroorotase [Desulfovibrionaceae bacterium]|nr:dihydroorotase [Desulfovibrionaceae bacterium]
MDLIVYNAMLNGDRVTIYVHDGVIQKIEPCGELPSGAFDAKGKKVFASFLDVHTHTREPGYTHKETIATALKAAVHGGFSGIMCMANTKPVNDSVLVTRYMLEKAKEAYPHGPYLYPIGATTIGLEGKEMSDMKALRKAGCVAFSNDGSAVNSSAMLRNCMEYAYGVGALIIEHCEDPTFERIRPINEGVMSSLLGVQGDPDISESIHVARAILLSDYLQIPIHLAHISSHRSVQLIEDAKKRGSLITAETCPHYLFLDDTITEGYNTLAKVNPPLRTAKDREALRDAIRSGVIDMLATDHAPHTMYEKEQPLDLAPFGISGLDTALSLTWELVKEGVIEESDIYRLWCVAPHSRFNLPYTTFEEGSPADFFLFDPDITWELTPENMHSLGKNTPFIGRTMHGKVTAHWIQGVQVI